MTQEGHPPAVTAQGDEGRRLDGAAANAYPLQDEDEPFVWDRVAPRRIDAQRWATCERYMGEILQAFGMDLDTPGTRRTPSASCGSCSTRHLATRAIPTSSLRSPPSAGGGSGCRLSQVIEGPIHFYSVCEHHTLPFSGVAHVGYVPHELIIGISKLTRLVQPAMRDEFLRTVEGSRR